jgi:hypothetical protein
MPIPQPSGPSTTQINSASPIAPTQGFPTEFPPFVASFSPPLTVPPIVNGLTTSLTIPPIANGLTSLKSNEKLRHG